MDPDDPFGSASGGPTPLRLAGFLTGALGGALVCVGSLLPWVRTGLEGLPDALSLTYYGIDLAGGLAVLALGVAMLACLVVARMAHGKAARVAGGLLIAASVLAIGVAGASAVTSADRFASNAVDDVLADLAPGGTETREQRAQVEELMLVRVAQGPFVALGGAILGAAGGVMLAMWLRRGSGRRPSVPHTDGAAPAAM
ncbi:MAG: Trp biosynthesis-associated membrane protein [Actinomycetota bacterium]